MIRGVDFDMGCGNCTARRAKTLYFTTVIENAGTVYPL